MSGIIGLISVSAATPGASEVKSLIATITSSTSRATMITPTSGTRVRVISASIYSDSATPTDAEIYFGTGSHIGVNTTTVIYETETDADNLPVPNITWPDGGGPVGAVDAVVSIRTTDSVDFARFIMHYREE